MSLFQKSVEKKYLKNLGSVAFEKNDKQIDQMVYELHGLRGEEIKIVEESL